MAWTTIFILAAILHYASLQEVPENYAANHSEPDLKITDFNVTDSVLWNVTDVKEMNSTTLSTSTVPTTTMPQQTTRGVPSSHITELSSIVMGLGVRLHKILRQKHPKKNFVFSPFCLASGLSMVYAGASGATKDQIGKLLGLGSVMNEDDLHHTFSHVHKIMISDIGNTTVYLANALFSSEGLRFKKHYSNFVRSLYSGETFSLNFNKGDKSLEYINKWISNQTDNLIEEALEPGSIHPPLLLLLLSVAHFQGPWAFPFPVKNTKLKQFYLAPNIGKDMYMMHTKKQKLYYGDMPLLKSKILEIPFEGDALSLYIILPNTITGLSHAEALLSSALIWRDMSRMLSVEIELVLPRFKIDTRIQLRSAFGALGSQLMLSPSLAELSGIADGANLFISGMTLNSVFELTEKGVEAASVIGQQIALSAINSVYQVRVDHPFLFFILDKRTKATLFMGRVVYPPVGSDSLADLGPLHQTDTSAAASRTCLGHNFTAIIIFLYVLLRL